MKFILVLFNIPIIQFECQTSGRDKQPRQPIGFRIGGDNG